VQVASRGQVLNRSGDAVASFRISGLKTNLPFHTDLLDSDVFSSGDYDTSVVSRLRP
jgi:acetyl-CoA carboxylase, biotin carboxylase subunit